MQVGRMGFFGFFVKNLYIILALQVIVDKSDQLERLDYKLFAAKTTYDNAREFVDTAASLPRSFGKNTLKVEHDNLLEENCEPVVFYFIGRHASRFPDESALESYDKHFKGLIKKLADKKAADEKAAAEQAAEGKVTDEQVGSARPDNQQFLDWKMRMAKEQGDMLTELGAKEEQNIAVRFKELYKEFFDTQTADIKFATTDKIRTAQSAAQFVREISGLDIPGCNEKSLPTNDINDESYNLDEIKKAPCYKHMTANYQTPILDFHNRCKKISRVKKIKDWRIDAIKDEKIKKKIAAHVAKKLGVPVTVDEMESIFSMCRFETALDNKSIWCNLFSRTDIEALEFIEDFNSYIKAAYGPKANPAQSCEVVKDLLEAFDEGKKMSTGPGTKKKAYFYFSHADPIKKLLAAFELFKGDEMISEKAMFNFIHFLQVPKDRSWRTSLISPFAANFAFILYRCSDSTQEQATFKVLTTVTERPVKLHGCRGIQCDSEDFFGTYDSMRQCDLNEICKPEQQEEGEKKEKTEKKEKEKKEKREE